MSDRLLVKGSIWNAVSGKPFAYVDVLLSDGKECAVGYWAPLRGEWKQERPPKIGAFDIHFTPTAWTCIPDFPCACKNG